MLMASMALWSNPARADNATWNAGGGDGLWSNPINWAGPPVAVPGTGNIATFNSIDSSGLPVDLGFGGVTIGGIVFDTGIVTPYIIGSGGANAQTLTFDPSGAVTVNSSVANNQRFDAAIVLGTDNNANAFTFTNNSTTNSLTFAGGISSGFNAGTKTLTVTGAGATTISGAITDGLGTVALTKSGAGTLTLSGANFYTGNTTVSAGTLLTTAATALPGFVSAGSVVFSGGTVALRVGGSGWTTTDVDTLLTTATKTSGALGIDTTNGDVTQWTAFTPTNLGSLSLAKLGSNTLTLNQANTYTGNTTVSAGTLVATEAAALSGYNTAGSVVFNGGIVALRVGGSGWTTTQVDTLLTNATKTSGALGIDTTNGSVTQWTPFTPTNLGSLGLVKLGTNALSLNQANTYTGGTTLTSGTLNINSDKALGAAAGAFAITTGTIDSTALFAADQWLTNNNAQIWNGNFTFTGTQNLNLGTGTVSLGSTAGSRTVTVSAKTLTVGGVISNGTATGLTKAGNGTLFLTGANTYTGATTVSAGTLQVASLASGGSPSNIGASTNTADKLILNGGTLRYTGAGDTTDRLFSLQASSTIDASGGSPVNFNNTGSMDFNGGTAAKTLTLRDDSRITSAFQFAENL
jgi:autotransporter-associated beta strand protein